MQEKESAAVGPVFSTTARVEYKIVDSHLHYLDFTQETDGFINLVAKMDEANVSHAIVFGMPFSTQLSGINSPSPNNSTSFGSDLYYFSATDYIMMEELRAQDKSIRERFYPFICGFNPGDKNTAKYFRSLLEAYPGEIYGIGELMSRRDDLAILDDVEPPRADHPSLLEVYDLAAEYDLPVLIHSNLSDSYAKGVLYLEEMQNALAHNRDTNIIWAHVGVARHVEVPNLLEIAEMMLAENDNLYYDLSWVFYEDYLVNDLSGWAQLAERYSDRIVLGTDEVGHWDTYVDDVVKYYEFLDILSPQTSQNLCRNNILKLIHVEEAHS